MATTLTKTLELNRVVITGMGALSPAGFGVQTLWDHLVSGQGCIKLLPEDMREKYGVSVAGYIDNFDPMEAGFTKRETRRFARFTQYSLIAADEAMKQAGMNLEEEDLTRFACIFGTGIGGMEIFEREALNLNNKGLKKVSPLFIPAMIPNIAGGNIAIKYGLRGECFTIITACATSTHCVGEAYRLIRYGLQDMAITGGAEEGVAPMVLAGFGNLGAVTKSDDPKHASCPFDLHRSGFVPGEGAGALVLESLEHAKARGANIIAEIVGFGSTGDGYHITAPEPHGEGIVRAMKQALAEGGFSVADIGHINAHGTSTPINDKTESFAIHALAEDAGLDSAFAEQIPVTSVKGTTGHTLGATGALEAIVTALSVSQNVVPPTLGFETPDPECNVSVSHELRKTGPQKVALSNSLGFGGHNGSLAIAPYVED